MHKFIITSVLFIAAFAFSLLPASAADTNPSQLQYSIKSSGSGQQGYWVVEVTAYVDKKVI